MRHWVRDIAPSMIWFCYKIKFQYHYNIFKIFWKLRTNVAWSIESEVQRPLAIDFVIRYNEGETFYNVLTSWIRLKAEWDGYTSSFCHFALLSSKFGWNILMMIKRVKTKLALCSSFARGCVRFGIQRGYSLAWV